MVFFVYKPDTATAIIISARAWVRRNREPMGAYRVSGISPADTLEKMGEFWDTHDFTDFDNLEAPDVAFQIACAVPN